MARKKTEATTRREVVIEAAVKQFSKAGYDSTTMRDIAAELDMLAGSIYYHFGSKEDLFLAVHETAIQRICDSVLRSIDPSADAWTRLAQAASGYLESMLTDYDSAGIIVTEFPRRRNKKLRDRLISHRQRFETLFDEIIEELPLRRDVDRSYCRLAILGMLAWTYVWYRSDGRDSPRVIAANLINLIKLGTEGDHTPSRPVPVEETTQS